MVQMKEAKDLLTERRESRYEPRVYFEHGGHEIVLVLSVYSGLERVYADNRRVSRRRNWRFRSVHAFRVDGVAYELEVAMAKGLKNLLGSEVDVHLRADGERVDQDRIHGLEYMAGKRGAPMTWKRVLFFLLPFFVAGGALGFVVGYLVLGSLL